MRGVPARQSLFVQKKVPVRREPLQNRQQIPVGCINGLAELEVTAEIVAIRPDFNRTPGNGMFPGGSESPIRIGSCKRDLHREAIAAANHDLALLCHQWPPPVFLAIVIPQIPVSNPLAG